MIGFLLDAARPRAGFADAVALVDETLAVTVGQGQDLVARRGSLLVQLRVERDGLVGWAGGDRLDVPGLVESAVQSLALASAPVPLLPPAPAPMPPVETHHGAVSTMGVPGLAALARQLRDRLERDGRTMVTWAERSVGRVDVGNTRGVTEGYDATLLGYGVDLRIASADGPLLLSLHQAAVAQPSDAEVSDLVEEVEARLAPTGLDDEPAAGAHPVWFGPRAVARLLAPVLAAAHAEEIARQHGPPPLSAEFTLVDDPTAPGRPGSRPIDDEGVVCRPTVVIERGQAGVGIADLLTAGRLGVPASGHGFRAGSAPARAGWSNLEVLPGLASPEDLARAAGDGLLVMDLPWPEGNIRHGRVRLTTPWAYRVASGSVVGRYPRATISGNVFEWLSRIRAVGRAARWIGPRRLPELVVEAVEVG